MNKQVHIVPHMHWDREWYFSAEESRILLVNNMEEILDRLETDDEYPHYVLDGQTIVLEDLLAVRPDMEERIRKLVQSGKLIIGPWYTQTDEMVVGAESIVRNLLYGLKDCRAFGEPMKIGYLPDSFGQSEQMPQLLNGFGIDRLIFWRGMTEHNGTSDSEFHWESPDGSRVLALWMPLGYAIGKYLPRDPEALRERMDKNFRALDTAAATPHLLIPNGHDQMPIQQDIHEVIEELRDLYPDRDFFLSDYQSLFDAIEEYRDRLQTVRGEFLEGKTMRVHKSIYSTRMDIKALNTRLENKVTRSLEPLASIAYTLGFAYPHGLIEAIWKEMMKNHAHDSIGCCCSDNVHREIRERFLLAEEKTDRLIDFCKRKIVDAMPDQPHREKLTLFNTLPAEREEVITAEVITRLDGFRLVTPKGEEKEYEILERETVDPGLIDRQIVHYGNYDPFVKYRIQFTDRLPAMGYKTWFVQEGDSSLPEPSPSREPVLENEHYHVTVESNGTLTVTDKALGHTCRGLLLVEESGDDGDEYDYSPPEQDWVLTSADVRAKVEVRHRHHSDFASIRYSLPVPADLESRRARRRDATVDVRFDVTLRKGTRRIDVRAIFDNQAKDHRLRVLFPTPFAGSFSVSDHQFGSIQRRVAEPGMDLWERENWSERPDAINPMLSYVGLHDSHGGFALLTDSTREYEITGERFDTIALTQFRSVGILGKADLIRRPGRPSGIALETPDSQMIGTISLDYAFTTHAGDTIGGGVPQSAADYLTPILSYNKIPHDAMKLNPAGFDTPHEYSLCRQDNRDTVLSVLKKAEHRDGLIFRFYNPSRRSNTETRLVCPSMESAHSANLNEEPGEPLSRKDGTIRVTHRPCQQQTVLITTPGNGPAPMLN